MNNYLERYNKRKSILLKNKELYEQNLKKAIEKYENIKNSDIDKKESRLVVAANNVTRRIQALQQINDQLSYLRPANEEDVTYRLRQYDEFHKVMQKNIPDDLPIRFHGCPIYTAKYIIESGELSSSVDRLGIETSYDTAGQISVTTKNSLQITVQGYAGLNGNYELPGGCIFVLYPKDELDAENGKSLLMGNVNIRKEPSRLFAIITTPENIETVKKWCQEFNMDSSKVYDYDSFSMIFNRNNNKRH